MGWWTVEWRRVVAIEGEHELAGELAAVARELIGAGDVQHALQGMVNLAVGTIEGCDHASISMVVKERIETPAQSDPTPEIIDNIQNDTGEGPCVDATRQDEVFETEDLCWTMMARAPSRTNI